MDRGAWWATVHRGRKELDMTEATQTQYQYHFEHMPGFFTYDAGCD